MLMPSCQVQHIPLQVDGKYNKTVRDRLDKAGKISLLDPQLVWIIHKAPLVRQVYCVRRRRICTEIVGPISRQVWGIERLKDDIDLEKLMAHLKSANLTPALEQCPDRDGWIAAQIRSHVPRIWADKGKRAQDGLWYVQENDGDPIRIIVPRTLQAKRCE